MATREGVDQVSKNNGLSGQPGGDASAEAHGVLARSVKPKTRYTVVKRGKLFWQPTPEMKALGFAPKSLGDDNEIARAEARRLAAAWDDARAGRGQVFRYPIGSFGAFYDGLRGSRDEPNAWWAKKSLRTREEYEQAWEQIDSWSPTEGGAPLSHLWPDRITAAVISAFATHLEVATSRRTAERTLKALRALLNVACARRGLKAPAAPKSSRGMVYFIEATGLDLVKIGAARNLARRLKELQTGCPVPMKVWGGILTDDPPGLERRLHHQFAEHRSRGEWFALAEPLQSFMASNL